MPILKKLQKIEVLHWLIAWYALKMDIVQLQQSIFISHAANWNIMQ